jgi:hypothetical protein
MFAQTEDQHLFERAPAGFLEAHYPVARVRALAGPPGMSRVPRTPGTFLP